MTACCCPSLPLHVRLRSWPRPAAALASAACMHIPVLLDRQLGIVFEAEPIFAGMRAVWRDQSKRCSYSRATDAYKEAQWMQALQTDLDKVIVWCVVLIRTVQHPTNLSKGRNKALTGTAQTQASSKVDAAVGVIFLPVASCHHSTLTHVGCALLLGVFAFDLCKGNYLASGCPFHPPMCTHSPLTVVLIGCTQLMLLTLSP